MKTTFAIRSGVALIATLHAAGLAATPAQSPLFLTGAIEPRVMLLVSRDHELSKKAYNDYSDLDGDGVLDTTYKDSIVYYGYFDSKKCYSYTNSRFEPAAAVTANTHQCNGSHWSGNFLNWASMTRMDVLRKTLYGGYRSTDSTTATVLERHFLPNDVHAFVKVFNPNSSATLSMYVPSAVVGSNTAISLCNVSDSTNTNLTGTTNFTIPAPRIKVAAGAWPQWDASEVTQCGVNIGNSTQPTAVLGTYNARVQVCVAGSLESNCKPYTHPTTGVQVVKPIGLLQQYGDVDSSKRTRFGLMTGSYNANKSGGVLRKNVGPITNNSGHAVTSAAICGNNHANDEINVCTGQFINQENNKAGIINTLNRLRIAGFQYTSNGRNDSHRYSCNSPGIASFNNGQCVDWGNPISELYLEALRYFANAGATAAFDVSDSGKLDAIPKVAWSDPLPATQWCTQSSIIVLSTGINSFDADELANFTPAGGNTVISALDLTQLVGDYEGITGNSYLVGDSGAPNPNNQCTAKTVNNLAQVKGICPEAPSMQGGYGIAGLAYAPKRYDLRPDHAAKRNARWGGVSAINKDWALRQPINTYTVQLAEALPSFTIPVGNGSVTLLPACMANSNGNPGAWTDTATGWRNCSMTNLIVDANVAQASVGTDATAKTNTCSGNGTTSQCFTIPWEDSTWGNDYDMDGIQRLGYCVGAACATFKMLCPSTTDAAATIGPWAGVPADQIRVATCAVQANAGHTLTFGYTITGTSNDGVSFPIYRQGGNNFNVGATKPADTAVSPASSVAFTQSGTGASLLKNPLWYAAKYGGFVESNPAGTPRPDLQSEWDAVNNQTGAPGADGVPDTFFDVRNPAQLNDRLANVIDIAANRESSAAAIATNSTRLDTETLVFQARFNSADWSGQLLAFPIDLGGVIGSAVWNTDNGIVPASGTRNIKTFDGSAGVDLEWANLTCQQKGYLTIGDDASVATNCANNANFYDNSVSGQNRVNWLKATNAATAFAGLRTRSKLLGDVVNSDPVFVYRELFAPFVSLDAPNTPAGTLPGAVGTGLKKWSSDLDLSYSAFHFLTKTNRTPMLYVGANDGMMHGFKATSTAADSGKELVAYVPNAVLRHIPKLTDPAYGSTVPHRFFVDGVLSTSDACIGTKAVPATKDTCMIPSYWRSVLVGSLGAGGKAVFALDVTNPPNVTVLWEKDASMAGWEDLGYLVGEPQVALMRVAATGNLDTDYRWVAVFGNGYYSSTGKAVLYIVDLLTGAQLQKIEVAAGPNNGLGPAAVFSVLRSWFIGAPNQTNTASTNDSIYVADINGKVYRYSVNFGTGVWEQRYVLFDAGRPITGPIRLGAPKAGDRGVMVFFGTGKYFDASDTTDLAIQSIYGIWDEIGGDTPYPRTRAMLQQQTIDHELTVSGKRVRVTSNHQFSYTPGTGNNPKGWYMDLAFPANSAAGERVTTRALLRQDRVIFTTMIPSTEPCSYGGTSWIMELDALTGARLAYSAFDINDDKAMNTQDFVEITVNGNVIKVPVSAIKIESGMIKPAAVIARGGVEYKIVSTTSGEIASIIEKRGARPGVIPRTSWCEIGSGC